MVDLGEQMPNFNIEVYGQIKAIPGNLCIAHNFVERWTYWYWNKAKNTFTMQAASMKGWRLGFQTNLTWIGSCASNQRMWSSSIVVMFTWDTEGGECNMLHLSNWFTINPIRYTANSYFSRDQFFASLYFDLFPSFNSLWVKDPT